MKEHVKMINIKIILKIVGHSPPADDEAFTAGGECLESRFEWMWTDERNVCYLLMLSQISLSI